MFFFPNSNRHPILEDMVTLLRKLFVKDYEEVEKEKVRLGHGRLAAIFGIITNTILVALKLSAALILAANSGWVFSMALIGDSINNIGDIASSVVTLIGFSMSAKPADKEHPYGHERIEYIAALIVYMLIIAAAVELLKSSLEGAIEGSTTTYDVFSLIVLGVSILLKIFQAYVNFGLGKAISSVALKATAIDSMTDSIATTIVLVCALLTYFFHWGFLDSYMGIAVSLFILYSGIRAAKEAGNPLIGQPASKEFESKIVKEVRSYQEVLGVHDVLCHAYGPTKYFVSLHAEVDAKDNLVSIHDVIDNIEETIREKYGCEITIHIDPIQVGNPEVDRLKEEVQAALKKLDENLAIHDFRIVAGETHTNVIFDCVIPYEKKQLTPDEITAYITQAFQKEKRYNFVIHYDRPYDE